MLNRFPPRSRLECCATCTHWGLRRINRRSITYCEQLNMPLLPANLTSCGCEQWRKEPRESFAIELYQKLQQELGQ
jgi:hypothetical protein